MSEFSFGGGGDGGSTPSIYTGWAQYSDTQYTAEAPFSVVADVDTIVPNNGLNFIDSQKPEDIATFYDGTVVTGRNGDGLNITFDATVIPSVAANIVEFWFEIGAGIELYRRIISFPKGAGVARPISFSVSGYTLDTWEATGATMHMVADGAVDIYGQRLVLTRTHKAR